jgi:hypothetical protein
LNDGGVFLLAGWFEYVDGQPVPQNMLYHLERTADAEYRFAVISTAPDRGLQWHPRRAFLSPPKIKYETALVFERVPAQRVLDDAWWLAIVAIASQKHQSGDDGRFARAHRRVCASLTIAILEIYDRLIPYLLNAPIEHCLARQRRTAPPPEYRTPQAAATDYYRTLREGCHYVLRRNLGLSGDQCKWLSLAVRIQYMNAIHNGSVIFLSADRIR